MILPMAEKYFGALLKSRREASRDPSTDRYYTQARLAEVVGNLTGEEISRSLVASWESDTSEPGTVHLNALARVPGLDLPVIDSAIALGLEVDQLALSPEERELLAAYRRLRASPALQETALRVIRALPAPPTGRRPTSQSNHS